VGDVPLLGACGGFQRVVLEYARNMLGFADAHHAEYDPYASRLFITALSYSSWG
jgi:CTP synthase (UTP-ammonia lyase)